MTEPEIEQLAPPDDAVLRLGELPDSERCLVRPPQRITFTTRYMANVMRCR